MVFSIPLSDLEHTRLNSYHGFLVAQLNVIFFGKIGFVPASSNTAGVAGHAPDQDPKDIIKAAITTGYRY